MNGVDVNALSVERRVTKNTTGAGVDVRNAAKLAMRDTFGLAANARIASRSNMIGARTANYAAGVAKHVMGCTIGRPTARSARNVAALATKGMTGRKIARNARNVARLAGATTFGQENVTSTNAQNAVRCVRMHTGGSRINVRGAARHGTK